MNLKERGKSGLRKAKVLSVSPSGGRLRLTDVSQWGKSRLENVGLCFTR